MADAETTPGLKPNLFSRHKHAHIDTYALPASTGKTAHIAGYALVGLVLSGDWWAALRKPSQGVD